MFLEERDKQWWMPNSKGNFSVKSAWDIIRSRKDPQKDILFIWEKGLPFKISFLMWRIWFKRIPIGEVLVRCRIVDSIECCCCNSHEQESFNHLFISCPDAKYLWNLFAAAMGMQGPFNQMRQTIYKWWTEDCAAK